MCRHVLVLIIARPKCTLAASHAAPGESQYADGTVRQTDRRYITPERYITLSAMDAAKTD